MGIWMETKHCIRAVIFDLGGVILRTDDPAPRTALASRLHMSRYDLEGVVFGNPVSLLGEEGKVGLEKVWENIVNILGLTNEDIVWVRRDFFGGDRVDMRLIQLIRSFDPRFKTGLLSNTWVQELSTYITEELGIPRDTFDAVVSSSYYHTAKPKPQIYQIALHQLGVKPEEAVFVDDNERNIAGAQAVGLETVLFRSFEQTQQELQKCLQTNQEGCA
jgi:epoxide hydrolase-like predicted phosphatase